MKISKARLRQIINESYQKILLEEPISAMAIGLFLAEFAAFAVAGYIVNEQHKKIRKGADRELLEYSNIISSFEENFDAIATCTAFGTRYDPMMLEQIQMYIKNIETISNLLGIPTPESITSGLARGLSIDASSAALKGASFWSKAPSWGGKALGALSFVVDAVLTESNFNELKNLNIVGRMRDDIAGFKMRAEDIKAGRMLEQRQEDEASRNDWIAGLESWLAEGKAELAQKA